MRHHGITYPPRGVCGGVVAGQSHQVEHCKSFIRCDWSVKRGQGTARHLTVAYTANEPIWDLYNVNEHILSAQYEAAYAEMIRSIMSAKLSQKSRNQPLIVSWPMVGCKFFEQPEILVVGRSLNGWDKSYNSWTIDNAEATNRAQSIASSARSEFEKLPTNYCCPMAWVPKGESPSPDDYNTNRSAFWRVIKAIVIKIGTPDDSGTWACRTAWSNIAKVSPSQNKDGNPSNLLRSAQVAGCVNLLKLEVRELQPKRVLIIAGEDWYRPFTSPFNLNLKKPVAQPASFVGAVARQGDTGWVFTERPDRRRKGDTEDTYVNEVVAAFGELL